MKKVLIISLVLIFGIVVTWNLTYPISFYSYKVTVEIETPEGVKTGYAIRKLTFIKYPAIVGMTGRARILRGEAVVVDLGKNGLVFALVNQDEYRSLFPRHSSKPSDKNDLTETVPRPTKFGSILVRFADLQDPTSVFAVMDNPDPIFVKLYGGEYIQSFEQAFGSGTKLKGITAEFTSGSSPRKVKALLPWIDKYRTVHLDGSKTHFQNKLPNILHYGHFVAE